MTAASALKGLGRRSVEWSSHHVPLSLLLRVSRATPLVVFYHVVSDHHLPHIQPLYQPLTTAQFERQIDSLLGRFVPVDLEAILGWLDGRASLPANAVYLTFDDGLREVAEIVAPILKRKGVTAAFFVNSAFIDNRDLFYRFKAALLISALSTASPAAVATAEAKLTDAGFRGRDATESIKMVTFRAGRLLDDLAVTLNVAFADYLARAKPYMDGGQISQLIREGFEIGGHGPEHAGFVELALAEQLEATRRDMHALCTRFEIRHRIFALPFRNDGVTDEYYDTVRRERIVEAVFGTGGWYHDPHRRLINRLWLEGVQQAPAEYLQQSLSVAMMRRLTLRAAAR